MLRSRTNSATLIATTIIFSLIVTLCGCAAGTASVAEVVIATVWNQLAGDQVTRQYSFGSANQLGQVKFLSLDSALEQFDAESFGADELLNPQLVNNTFVLGQETEFISLTLVAQDEEMPMKIYMTLDAGQLSRSGDAVTFSVSQTIRYVLTTPEGDYQQSGSLTATLTGTASEDGRTLTFTSSSVEVPGSGIDPVEQEIDLTWELESGNALTN